MKSHLTVTHDILQLVPCRRCYRLLSAKTSCSVRCFWKCLFLQDVWSAAQFDPVDSQSNVTPFRGCRLLFHSKHPALWPSETMQLYMILCGLCKSLDIKYVSSVLRIKELFFFFLKSAHVSFTFCLFDLVHLSALIQSAAVKQDAGVISASVGDNVTLQCFYDSQVAMHFSWYRQTLGGGPELLTSIYKYDKPSKGFHWMEKHPRFYVQMKDRINHLHISDVHISDSATYFCGSSHSNRVEFGEGVFLSVKGIVPFFFFLTGFDWNEIIRFRNDLLPHNLMEGRVKFS